MVKHTFVCLILNARYKLLLLLKLRNILPVSYQLYNDTSAIKLLPAHYKLYFMKAYAEYLASPLRII